MVGVPIVLPLNWNQYLYLKSKIFRAMIGCNSEMKALIGIEQIWLILHCKDEPIANGA